MDKILNNEVMESDWLENSRMSKASFEELRFKSKICFYLTIFLSDFLLKSKYKRMLKK